MELQSDVFSVLPDAALVVAGDGAIVRANSHAHALFGYADGALIGQSIETLVPVGARMAHAAHRKRMNAAPHARKMGEVRLLRGLRADGREFPLDIALGPVASDRGPAMLAIVRDITEQVRAREFVGTILDSLSASVAVLDGSGRIVCVNEARRRFAHENGGAPCAVTEGADFLAGCAECAVRCADTAAPVHDGVRAVLVGAAPAFTCEYPIDDLDGRRRWFLLDASPLRDGSGAVVAHVDVTERRAVAERLAHSQRQEGIGRLAGGIAHDLNNILVAIFAGADLLALELPPDSPCREYASEIGAAARRARDLTQRLLAFSRRQVFAPQVIDCSGAVAQQSQILRRLLPEDVELCLELPTDAQPVLADPQQLEQVVLNLVVNARDAMLDGGTVTLLVSRVPASEAPPPEGPAPAAEPSAWVRLRVEDSGVGMSETVRARIFEPFFTTKREGTGIGLATVLAIVQQMGGRVTVESTPGRGSRFDVYLPLAGRPISRPPAPPPERRGSARARLILVVDDEPAVRAVVARVLERAGHGVVTAASGEEALALVRRDPSALSLLLTDVVMPGLGGRELAERIRGLRGDLPVVFMTGHTDDELLRRGPANAAGHRLRKPFEMDELLRMVSLALGDGPAPNEPSA